MTTQPEALRLADALERDCHMNWPDYDNQMDAAAELRRLHEENKHLNFLLEQNNELAKIPRELIARITALETANAELLEALSALVSYTKACEALLHVASDSQVMNARAAIAKHGGAA